MAITDKAQMVPIDSLKPYKGNARIGDIDAIRESLRKNGQYRPIVVRKKTREVLAGNHTWEAARQEGWTEIETWFVDCDAQTAKRINLVDNKAPELGGYNEEALIAQLASIPDLIGTGWTDIERTRLTSGLISNIGGDTDPAEIPEDPRTNRGDIWELGEHRLICGDATSEKDADSLFAEYGNEQAIALWTDPPYLGPDDNSSHGENARPNKVGHSVDGLRQQLSESFAIANAHLAKGSALYVCHPGGANSAAFSNAFINQGWRLRQTLIWLKESPLMGYHDYHQMSETFMMGDKPEEPAELISYGFTRGRRKDRGWYGNRQQVSVMQFDRPSGRVAALHPSVRPVGLIERCLVNSTLKDALVYEPFCGSGSVMIACENLGRRCAAIEIDPGYCDVIVDRWERHTGLQAKKVTNG